MTDDETIVVYYRPASIRMTFILFRRKYLFENDSEIFGLLYNYYYYVNKQIDRSLTRSRYIKYNDYYILRIHKQLKIIYS